MIQSYKKIVDVLFISFIFMNITIYSQEKEIREGEVWKYDLQILLGFTGDDVDGIMGIETFTALKRFAYHYDLTDVVLRGEFEDIEFWGFEQYLIKYHKYWIREIKNQRIFKDIHDKEYLKQADETLYTFEIAIQNAKLEVERLSHAKSQALRLAQEKQELEDWEMEKREAERLTAELNQSILEAEIEADKWALERIRAERLASEKEELERLSARKAEAIRLTRELEGIIGSAKSEIDRLIDENKKMKKLIEDSEKTETMAEELLKKLAVTQNELDDAQGNIQDLSSRNDTLEIKLNEARIEIEEMLKYAVANLDSQKQKKWYQNISMNFKKDLGFDINNNNLISESGLTPTIALDFRYHLPWKPKILKKEMSFELLAEYFPSFTYDDEKTQLISAYVQGQMLFKWGIKMNMKLGASNSLGEILNEDVNRKYISFVPALEYELPLKYKFISTSVFLSPQVMKLISGGDDSDNQQLIFWNFGLGISIN